MTHSLGKVSLVALLLLGCATLLDIDHEYGDLPNAAGQGGGLQTGGASFGGSAQGGSAQGGSVPGAGGMQAQSGADDGAAGSSGDVGSGGDASTGGVIGNGGTPAAGGTGGVANTGGTKSSGGVTSTGGTTSSGGASGGTTSSGGSVTATGGAAVVSPLLRVQQGSTTLTAGTASRKVSLTTLNPSRAFLLFGTAFNSTSSSKTEVSGQITGTAELTFARTAASGSPAVPIRYYVAEFASGVLVQRGSTTLTAKSMQIALPTAVDPNRSFPLITFRNAGSVYGLDDYVRAKITGPKELTLSMYQAFGDGVVEWQVVSFDGAQVTTGDLSFGSNDAQLGVTLSSAVDKSKTWLLLSYQVADIGTGAADLLIRGRVDGERRLAFERLGTGATAQLSYYAVSFENGSQVQSASAVFADTQQQVTAELVPVTRTKSVAVAGGMYQRGGASSYAQANNPGYGTFTLDLTQDSVLSLERGAAIAQGGAALDWYVVDFQ